MSSTTKSVDNMERAIASLLVLTFLLLQGCLSPNTPSKVRVITVVNLEQKKKIDSGSVKTSSVGNSSVKSAVKQIVKKVFTVPPDGDPCRLDPSGPSCTSVGFLQACPAQSLLDRVPTVAQKTGVWCWAASAESILEAHETTKPQCQIVSEVEGLSEKFCCEPDNVFNPECWVNGWPHEAFNNLRASEKYDFKVSGGPLTLQQLAYALCEHGPISFVILGHGGDGHTFVVKDLVWEDGELLLWVGDHSWSEEGLGTPAEFQKWSYEKFKRGIYQGYDETNSEHIIDYYALKRLQE